MSVAFCGYLIFVRAASVHNQPYSYCNNLALIKYLPEQLLKFYM